MKLARVTTNGRITIPAELRKKYNLSPGRKVKFEMTDEGVRLIPLATLDEIRNNIGFLGTGGKMLKKLMEEKKSN